MKNMLQKIYKSENFILLIVYIILFILLSIFVPYFFTNRNFIGLMISISQIGMLAGTMTLCLASKDFDLSIGSQVAFAGVMIAVFTNVLNSFLIAFIIVMIIGYAIGFANGILVTKVNINALIATLATQMMIRGLAYISSGGQGIGTINNRFLSFGSLALFHIPIPIWSMVLAFIITGVILNQMPHGKNALAVGGNMNAVKLSGISVDKVRIINFTLQGVVAAYAGIVLATQMTSGQPNASMQFELNVISACVLGGVSLNGGKATISGVIIGVLIMGTIENAMNLLNIDSFYQYLVRGSILLIAVGADQSKNKKA